MSMFKEAWKDTITRPSIFGGGRMPRDVDHPHIREVPPTNPHADPRLKEYRYESPLPPETQNELLAMEKGAELMMPLVEGARIRTLNWLIEQFELGNVFQRKVAVELPPEQED